MTEFDFTKAHRKEAWLFLKTVWQGLDILSVSRFSGRKGSEQNLARTSLTLILAVSLVMRWSAITSFGTRAHCIISSVFSKGIFAGRGFGGRVCQRHQMATQGSGAHVLGVAEKGGQRCDTGHEHCAFPGIQLQVRRTF